MLMGCQHFERARECRALADGVNPELRELSGKFNSRGSISSEEYREVSAIYARVAKRIQNVKLKDAELARLARELGDNLATAGRSCDRLAIATRNGSPSVEINAQRDLEGLTQRHQSTVIAIDRRCVE